VGFHAFHEGRGAGKTDPQGGHTLVNRKKIVNRKRKTTGKRIVTATETESPTSFPLIVCLQ
jgi:hypothetical protein